MNISRNKSVLIGLVATAVMACQPANAGFSQGDSVTLGGKPVFRMAAAGGFGADHRAWLTQDALDNALVLAGDRSPEALTVARQNGAVVLLLDGRRIATVDAESASIAGLTVDELAQQWAQSVQQFLSDPEQTSAYLATLKSQNLVQGSVAILERKMYAPAGMTFAVNLTTPILSASAREGDLVEATLSRDVPMGRYVIPAGSVVIGEITQDDGDTFGLRFNSLRTANGSLMPISGIVINNLAVENKASHSVCTYAIPSGMANGSPSVSGRIPAGIGIGVDEVNAGRMLVFRGAGNNLVVGLPMLLQFSKVTEVAVVMRQGTM